MQAVRVIDDHADLANKGTNTHAQLDTHVADTTIHGGGSPVAHATTHQPSGTDAISTAAAGASAVADTAAVGTATSLARSDHRHSREAFGSPVTQAFSDAAADGTATTVARSDHRHGMPASPGGGGGSLTIEEVDGSPTLSGASKLILAGGSVAVSGTEATYTPAGSGGAKGDVIVGAAANPASSLYLAPPSSSFSGLNGPVATVYELGAEFSCSTARLVSTLGWWRPNTTSVAATGLRLWDTTSSGSPIINITSGITDNGAAGPQMTDVSSLGITLVAGRHYVASYAHPLEDSLLSNNPTPGTGITHHSNVYATPAGTYPTTGIGNYLGANVGLGVGGTPAGDLTRLPAGSNGQYLVWDSAATNGLAAQVLWQTLTDGATVNWNVKSGLHAQVTLGGNRTLAAPTNLIAGQTYVLHVVQDATGSRTLTWPGAVKWPGGTAPTLSTGANKRDVFVFACDGSSLFCVSQALDVR